MQNILDQCSDYRRTMICYYQAVVNGRMPGPSAPSDGSDSHCCAKATLDQQFSLTSTQALKKQTLILTAFLRRCHYRQ